MNTRMLPIIIGCALLASACAASSSEPSGAAPSAAASGDAESKCFALAAQRPAAAAGQPEAVTVSHVLVKHQASKNPVDGVTRTRGEACLRAAEARDKALAGAKFDELVASYSDEPGAATRSGSLGEVKRAVVDPAFADVAFDLGRGQMSDIVETPFGFHLILRNE